MTITVITPTPAPYGTRRQHGTRVKYVIDKCRCEPCTVANREAESLRYRAMHRPDQLWLPYVPADRARAHVKELMAQGVGPKSIAKLSGVPHGAISKLVYGDYVRGTQPSRRIRPATEAKLLAVTIDTVVAVQDRQRVPGGPTWALLDDLIARGYTKAWLGQRITSPGAKSLQLSREWVYARTARRVAALHRLLGDKPGPGRKNPWNTRRASS